MNFIQVSNRQSVDAAKNVLVSSGCNVEQSVVLATSNADIIMASNSKLLSLVTLWSDRLEDKTKYAMGINKPESLNTIMDFLKGTSPWFSIAEYNGDFKIYSLTNAGDFNSLPELAGLTRKLNENLKIGSNTYHNVFRFILASSILKTTDLLDVDYWGFYPSSKPTEPTEEIIYKYYEYAKRSASNTSSKMPLFVRTQPSPKRSLGEGGDRLDPNNQLNSLMIHPYYEKGNKLVGKKVAIIDDFTTNGTSFWVAYSLLKKAGVSEVRGIAMGKFGRKLLYYQINLNNRNPFENISVEATFNYQHNDTSIYSKEALCELKEKMKDFL